eukprot:17303_1
MAESKPRVSITITGKYIDFKKEEYDIMKSRIDAVNIAMTDKCLLLSLKPLEKNFCFDFVFCQMDNYLSKIELYDKKQRKDDLKKWWMNQKASEMAKECLPTILDRMDQISTTIAKQERCELSRTKFEKYIKFELLECAFKCSFRRPRSSSANVFPNTSFQYARSRLRRKLESEYFTESELQQFGLNNAARRKKKEEWIRAIETKKTKYKEEYFALVTKRKNRRKNRHKHHHHHHHHQHSDDSSCSSDMPIMEGGIPPPPPPSIPPILNMNMPQISTKKPSGYCSQCTSYAIQISKLCKELHSFKVSLGETQMELNHKIQEVNHWKKQYVEAHGQDNANDANVDYKQKYDELQSQIALLIGGQQQQRQQQQQVTALTRPRGNSQNSMSFVSDPFSVNPGSDKMSVSNADSSTANRYPSFMQMHVADSVHLMPRTPDQSMRQIADGHFKRSTDSTEKMLEKIKHNQNKTGSSATLTIMSSTNNTNENPFLNAEVESMLFPIDSNKNERKNNRSSSTTVSMQSQSKNNNNNNNPMQYQMQPHHPVPPRGDRTRHNSNPLPDYNHINNMTLQRVHSSNNKQNQIPTMIPQFAINNNDQMMSNGHMMHYPNNNNGNQYYANNIPSFHSSNPPMQSNNHNHNNMNPSFMNNNAYNINQTVNI